MLFLALLLRIGLLLSATPVGAMTQEILYLRGDVFRPMVRLVLGFLVLEGAELLLPSLVDLRVVQAGWAAFAVPLIDLVQAVLLVLVALATLRAFGPYSRRSLAELEVLARRSVEGLARRVGRRQPAEARARPRRGL